MNKIGKIAATDVLLNIISEYKAIVIREFASNESLSNEERIALESKLNMLIVEEELAMGTKKFDGWEFAQKSILEKIHLVYTPIVKAMYGKK